MARYHLYSLRHGMLVGSTGIEADNDGEAIRIAREQGDGEFVEVWNDHRRIRIVKPTKGSEPNGAGRGTDLEAMPGSA